MRSGTDKVKLWQFIDAVGVLAEGPGNIFLVGGATALLLDVRDQTIDIDIKLDPEPKAIFEGIAKLKERLNVNIELASPDDFMPALPGWRERSEFIAVRGPVSFYHYDFYAQALSKILRGHRTDSADANAFVKLGKIEIAALVELFEQIRPGLLRYPSIDPELFAQRVGEFALSNG